MSYKLKPARAVKPGEILKEELEERGWTQEEFAEIIERPKQAISEIIVGKKAITTETAVLFSQAFGTSPELWLNLETAYRLSQIDIPSRAGEVAQKAELYELAPIKEMGKKGWIECKDSVEDIKHQLLYFFGVEDINQIGHVTAARFRISEAHSPVQASLLAWLRRAEVLASKMQVMPYSESQLKKAISGLRRMSIVDDPITELNQYLANLGVRFVIVPHLSKTYVDGAAFWLDAKSPVVVVSLRYKRVDNFWFTIMHELAHILLHADNGSRTFVDVDVTNKTDDIVENEANDAASEWLISQNEYINFREKCNDHFSKRSIIDFAGKLGIHQDIVIGRIHHSTGNFRLMSSSLHNICDKAELERINNAA